MTSCTNSKLLDRIEIYQNVVLPWPFAWGIIALLSTEGPTYVSAVMPPHIYTMWIWIHVFAPIVVWVGQILKPPRVKWWLQLGGHIALLIMSTIYVIGALTHPMHEQDVFYQLLFVYGFGSAVTVLTYRDIREIARSEGVCTQRE